jgi:NAD-dependent dihydropyrimidine dehydrogenase PreA subunit
MPIQVNQQLCAGCGACIEACPVGAIHLVDHWAMIDAKLCTQCEVCVDACPNGAITALSAPAHNAPIVALPMAESNLIDAPTQTILPEAATPTRGLSPLAGSALAYLGREVVPRLADVLVAALERRLERSATVSPAPLSTTSRCLTRKERGIRRQARYRGGLGLGCRGMGRGGGG